MGLNIRTHTPIAVDTTEHFLYVPLHYIEKCCIPQTHWSARILRPLWDHWHTRECYRTLWKEYIDQNALFLQGWSIYLITAPVGRVSGAQKYKLLELACLLAHEHSIKLFSDTCSTFGPLNKAQDHSPTDEPVFCRKVEVAVQLQVPCPPLHPLLLDVCVKGKHPLHLKIKYWF